MSFRCTECDATFETFESAARCHFGIGGVDEFDKAEVAVATVTPIADWQTRHHRAVAEHQHFGHITPDDPERAVLRLFDALNTWLHVHAVDGIDPYSAEHVVAPLIEVCHRALDFNVGRLDQGMLSAQLDDLCERLGIDPETGELR